MASSFLKTKKKIRSASLLASRATNYSDDNPGFWLLFTTLKCYFEFLGQRLYHGRQCCRGSEMEAAAGCSLVIFMFF